MKLYAENEHYKLYHGNMLDMLEVIEPCSIDSIITDPPYGLTTITKRFGKENSAEAKYGNDGSFQRLSKGFMGKEWDGSGIEYNVDGWRKCYEVLKPGGYLLAFGGSRTFHRIACAIEDAGFEIRDTIMWLYGSGFPKSMNIGLMVDKKNEVDNTTGNIRTDGKATNSGSGCYNCNNGVDNSMKREYAERIAQNEWKGWGTALKPSYEPVIVARKPCEGSCIDNVLKWGVGGLNIDECRVPFNGDMWQPQKSGSTSRAYQSEETTTANGMCEANANGRYPSNTILTYDETDYDEVCGGMPETESSGSSPNYEITESEHRTSILKSAYKSGVHFDDEGSAARYFYCAKASKRDRDEGLNESYEAQTTDGYIRSNSETARKFGCNSAIRRNTHPTVKPTDLMQYLIRLVTPRGVQSSTRLTVAVAQVRRLCMRIRTETLSINISVSS